MNRINTVTGLFAQGDPSTGTKGTIVTADWLNQVQESLMAFTGDSITVQAYHTLTEPEGIAFCDTTGGQFTLTLPAYGAVTASKRYVVKNIAAAGAPDLIIAAAGGRTIDGEASISITAGEKITIIKDGNNWQSI